MGQNNMNEEEKKFIAETAVALSSEKEETVLAKLNELKSRGKAIILPYVLNLLKSSNSTKVREEVIFIISNVKDQNSVPHIIKYIQQNQGHEFISQVIAACWQSQLDYSKNLNTFIKCFISGDYQVAIESFTVIEEMLWRSDSASISECKRNLEDGIGNIDPAKMPLYNELIKVLDEGRSKSHDEYSDLVG